jgi:SAM-dependent methyltransferase
VKKDEIRKAVRDRYGSIAASKRDASPSCCAQPSCCSGDAPELSETMGYTPEDLAALPEGANMGLGCGNLQAIAALREGETVLDLGSGAGIDCFLAAARVGHTGSVIGVDMTPEMVERARANAAGTRYGNVEFRLGEIEHLPVADASVDVIISNCVINLSADKRAVMAEAFRVLRPGGRVAISDVVAVGEMPEAVRNDPELYSACVAGAVSKEEYEKLLRDAGFADVRVDIRAGSSDTVGRWSTEVRIENYAAAAHITARKLR